jgi:hypothetical protein
MISKTRAKVTIKQNNIHNKSEERLGRTTRSEWLGLTAGLLDRAKIDVFTIAYIS